MRRRLPEEGAQQLYAQRYRSLIERIDGLEQKLLEDLVRAGHRLTELDALTRRVDAQSAEIEQLWSVIDDLTKGDDDLTKGDGR